MIFNGFVQSMVDTDAEHAERSRRLADEMFGIFVGRDNVYSTQSINKDGRKAFYPFCISRFRDGCQIKKGIRNPCDECSSAQHPELTKDVLYRHVTGAHIVGLYLINQSKVRLVAVDFDDHTDGSADSAPAPTDTPLSRGVRLIDEARKVGVTAFLERSGGGKGAHVWIFFRDWVTPTIARRLMELLLRRANLPLDVEVFPRQRDARKYGNLIALPYQGGPPRWSEGKSIFVNPETLDPLDPLVVMESIKESLLSEFEVAQIRKEYNLPDDDTTSSVGGQKTEEAPQITLVDNPVDAVFAGCTALRSLRDDPPYTTKDARHGRSHWQRLTLASVFRLIPGGIEAVHKILVEKCEDYVPERTDRAISSLTQPPMTCMSMQTCGICHGQCQAIRDRGSRSPAAFAYQRGATPNDAESGLVEIRITTDQREMYEKSMLALATHPKVYNRGGLLATVVDYRIEDSKLIKNDPVSPKLKYISRPWVSRYLSDVAAFLKYRDRQGWSAADPPDKIVDQFLEPLEVPPLRPLLGITESPLQLLDGTIIEKPGYNSKSGFYYQPFEQLPRLPESPTHDDALRARDELLEVVREFPFDSENGRSAWLSMVLTYFARPSIRGSTPLFVIDANVRSAGKSLLAQVAAIIMTGNEVGTCAWTVEERENQKSLTSMFIIGSPVILFDNVTCELGGASLNRALTTPIWNDRILGENRMTGELRIYSIIVATCNNATFGKDTIRRTIHCRLNSPMQNPEDRVCERAELRKWTKENRPRLVNAALTILRAYDLSGAEKTIKIVPMADYIEWSKIRRIITWINMPDPLISQKVLATNADKDSDEHCSLIASLKEAAPDGEWVTAAELLRRAEFTSPGITSRGNWSGVALRDCIFEYMQSKDSGKLPSAKVFGKRLSYYRDRVANGEKIVSQRNSVSNTTEWRVEGIYMPEEVDA